MMSQWERYWETRPAGMGLVERERESDRWRLISRFVRDHLGTLKGLKVIELGSGMGTNGLCFASEGAQVTALDLDALALRRAQELYSRYDLPLHLLKKDLLVPPDDDLRHQFDVAMSFGLAEHFVGGERETCIRRHFEMVKPGGLVIISVPNQSSWIVRLDTALLSLVRRWEWGWRRFSRRRSFDWPIEVPFTKSEMERYGQELSGDSRVNATNYGEGISAILRWVRYPLSSLGLNRLASSLDWPMRPMPGFDRRWGISLVLLARRIPR